MNLIEKLNSTLGGGGGGGPLPLYLANWLVMLHTEPSEEKSVQQGAATAVYILCCRLGACMWTQAYQSTQLCILVLAS